MITKGGLDAITISLAQRIREEQHPLQRGRARCLSTPLCTKTTRKSLLETLSPMGTIADSKEIADAVVYLTEARHVTGEVLHVDGGAHVGRW